MLSRCRSVNVLVQGPLLLGGEDAVHNLQRTDAEVHWTLTSQLLKQVST